jgi:uncharacterized protein (TIGR03790 family)
MRRAESRWRARVLTLLLAGWCATALADGLDAAALGVVFNRRDPVSARVASYYADRRGIPARNLVGLELPDRARITRAEFARLHAELIRELPTSVQSLLLVWTRPYAVECMSVTTAFAAGYRDDFCMPGCARTRPSPLFDSEGWLPADTVGWLPAMLLPTDDEALARRIIDRGVQADGTAPAGTVYLVETQDRARNVRAAEYGDAASVDGNHVRIRVIATPVRKPHDDIIAYFTGISRVVELPLLRFRPGAVADHLTSFGGILEGHDQMSVLDWLAQGATGSYGTVSEPCNLTGKFPDPALFLDHYLRGETLMEAYWKSVAMPGQGLFVGEPLARPYPRRHDGGWPADMAAR